MAILDQTNEPLLCDRGSLGRLVEPGCIGTVFREHLDSLDDTARGRELGSIIRGLASALKDETAPDQMIITKVPKKVFVVTELPRNPSGKILKRELRQKYEGYLKEL